jgi:predicted nucleic acid-binding protein
VGDLLVVADTGPLITLSVAEALPALRGLYARVVITRAVADELAAAPGRPGADLLERHPWIEVVPDEGPMDPALAKSLDAGEASSILLALRLGADLVLLDERRGRRFATRAYGLSVIGSVGVLVRARKAGLVGPLKPVFARLLAAGIHVGPALVEGALAEVGE